MTREQAVQIIRQALVENANVSLPKIVWDALDVLTATAANNGAARPHEVVPVEE